MSSRRAVAALAVIALGGAGVGSAGCCLPVHQARRTAEEPPSVREEDARLRAGARRCDLRWRFLFPGLGQVCLNQPGSGAALGLAGVAELGAVVVASQVTDGETSTGDPHPAVNLPVLGFADLYLYGVFSPTLDLQLAQGKRFVPQDTLLEQVAAPFNLAVLRRTEVWAGILATAALVTAGVLIDGGPGGGNPNVLGAELPPALGYPLGGAIYVGLFEQVAVTEETIFRGFSQSGLAREFGEGWGWGLGTAIFGLAHVPNALQYDTAEEKRDYLLFAIPIVTAVGGYLGATYKWSGYSLAPPIALHFWYDFLLSLGEFVANPQTSTLSARIAVPF